MTEFEQLVKALDEAIWEMGEAFKGLPDEDVWKRADHRLLSVGELAGHVAYWESKSFLDDGVESPLAIESFRYYEDGGGDAVALPLGAEAVYAEVKRIHEASKEALLADPPDLEAPNERRDGWPWGSLLRYQAFHVAYHTGQMYSVRHLLGHQTVDN
ncbi:MAG: DinB family protein [Fimbriimonadaceae bacterium]